VRCLPTTRAIVLLGASAFLDCLAPTRLRGLEVRHDVAYGHADGVALLLDVGIPQGQGPFPVAILVHGGGWARGDKGGSDKPGDSADITPWFAPLSQGGVLWFSINYRMAPAHRWPACLEDVQTAVRWVKAHAADYQGDPRRIALFGHSAGGHLACLAAVEAGDDTRVQAVVGCAPVTDSEYELPGRGGMVSSSLQALFGVGKEVTPPVLQILRETAPIQHVHPGLPPFLLIQGDADKTVPIQETRNFMAKLQADHVPVEWIAIPGAPHRLLSWQQFDPHWTDRVVEWLQRTLATAPDAIKSK